MNNGYKGRSTPAAPQLSFLSSYQISQQPDTTTTTTKQPLSNKYPALLRQNTPFSKSTPPPRPRMTKCSYCGNDSDTYSCNCGSDFASTSSFDKSPTSLNDPKPELGSGSSDYTGLPRETYTSTQSTEYVGKTLSSSSSGTKK